MALYSGDNDKTKKLPEVEVLGDKKAVKAYRDSLALYEGSVQLGADIARGLADGYYKQDLMFYNQLKAKEPDSLRDWEKDYLERTSVKSLQKEREKTYRGYWNKLAYPAMEEGTDEHQRYGDTFIYDDMDKWPNWYTRKNNREFWNADSILNREIGYWEDMIKTVDDKGVVTQGMAFEDISSAENTLTEMKKFQQLRNQTKNIDPIGFIANAELPWLLKYKKPTGVGLPTVSPMKSRSGVSSLVNTDVPSARTGSLFTGEYTPADPIRFTRTKGGYWMTEPTGERTKISSEEYWNYMKMSGGKPMSGNVIRR